MKPQKLSLLFLAATVAVIAAFAGCGTGDDASRTRPDWSRTKLQSRQLKTFDTWLALSGVQLTDAQKATLEKDGALFGVVPVAQLPVKHHNGLIEVTPETHAALEASNGLDDDARFETRWTLGLYDPTDEVQAELAEDFLNLRTGLRTHHDALDAGGPPSNPPDAGMPPCKATCSATVSGSAEQENECDCSEGYIWDRVTDAKSAITKSGTLTVSCSWNSSCSQGVQAHVGGVSLYGVADCQGSSAIYDATYGASWSGSAAVAVSETGQASTNFNQTLEFKIGSNVSGTTKTGSTSQVSMHGGGSGSAKASGQYPGSPMLEGSSNIDATVDASGKKTSAKTWLYGPTDTTSAHSLNHTMGSRNEWWLTRQVSNKSTTIVGTAGGCACAIVKGTFTNNAAYVKDHVKIAADKGAASCGTYEGTCTMQ